MEEITITYTRKVSTNMGKRAKVNPDIVRAIRKESAQGMTQVALAKKYGIAQPNISKIIRRISWKFVEDLPSE